MRPRARVASREGSGNLANFSELLAKDGEAKPDFEDELVAKSCVVRSGEVRFGKA